MDLLFKRYASPFLLLSQMILTNELSDFISALFENINDEKLWDFYIHKVSEQSFEEFKASLFEKAYSTDDFEATINDSLEIIEGFRPPKEGRDMISGYI